MNKQEILAKITNAETFYNLTNGNKLLQYRGQGHLILRRANGETISTTHALSRKDITERIVDEFCAK